MELFEAIKGRRSVRKYKTEGVDNTLIEKILEAGRWAPSWANSQCWRFIVVRDPNIKAEIADTLINIKLSDKEVNNPGKKAINTVPVLIVLCAEMGKSGYNHGGNTPVTDKGDWFMFDIALATQNMVLTAHDMGLGTVIIGAFDAPMLEKILGVPQGYRVVTLFPVGIPAQKGSAPQRRKLSDICSYDKWSI